MLVRTLTCCRCLVILLRRMGSLVSGFTASRLAWSPTGENMQLDWERRQRDCLTVGSSARRLCEQGAAG